MENLTQEELKSEVHYDPDTGLFKWLERKGRRNPDVPAGALDPRGYIRIGVLGKRHWAHRLAWLYVYGHLPERELDHVNRNRSDNRIVNLRLATRNMNNGNSEIWKTNTSGFRGVSWDKRAKKYECYIWKLDKKHHLGYFSDPLEAAMRYNKESIEYFGEYATVNKVDM